jgi:demethylmenaquinone methyltransferase/2-methoxy-6-polyprenyl-1,4-benzoquinol methylase
MQVTPYNNEKSKKEQVADMFDNISARYDFLNRFLSLGIDVGWRRKTVKSISTLKPQTILDVATGTADLAIELTKTGAIEIVGVDISKGMLAVGDIKIKKKKLDKIIKLQSGDSENLPFEDNCFDVVTVAFGVRNFENPLKGLQEIRRVLKPAGRLFVLEFSQPQHFPVRQLYFFYFRFILPVWGKIISKDDSAYRYLPDSVRVFPYGKEFLTLMEDAGFTDTSCREFTFGISSLYQGKK